MYVRSLVAECDIEIGGVYEVIEDAPSQLFVVVRDGVGCNHDLWRSDVVYLQDQNPALTSTTHVLKIEHKFKVTKTIDNTVQLELQHGVYSKDNVQELIDILVKVKEEM